MTKPSKLQCAAEQLRRDLATLSPEELARMSPAERKLAETLRAAVANYLRSTDEDR